MVEDPFEQAFFLMVHIPYLQAFEDVNKRTSRLAANIPFIRDNLRPLSFVDVILQPFCVGQELIQSVCSNFFQIPQERGILKKNAPSAYYKKPLCTQINFF